MTNSENWRAAAERTGPERMPYGLSLTKASWERYGAEQEKVILAHPQTWPNWEPGTWRKIQEGPWSYKEDPKRDFVDDWGCVWRTTQYGYVGTIVEHPLADADTLRDFVAPPEDTYNGGQTSADFQRAAANFARAREHGGIARGGLDHGFFMLRLEYLRGFENLMCDLIEPSDEFRRLHRRVHELNMAAVRNWLAAGAEVVGLPEDLGGQDRSLIGPKYFRQWVLPCYLELHRLAQDRGAMTYFHCDGNIMDIADQILEINPTIFNPQDVANGIENLRDTFKGKITLDLDFDRQFALPFGSPQDIRELIEYEVRTLGAPEGGLMIKAEIRGDVPPDNLEATVSALEEFSTFWS